MSLRGPFRSTEHGDTGVILLGALIVMLAMLGIGLGVLLVTDVDVRASANQRDHLEVRASSEAALELGISELARRADWGPLLRGDAGLLFSGAWRVPSTGEPIDEAALTAEAQRQVYGPNRWGADTPQWRLVGHGVPGADLPVAGLSNRSYVLLWISDDVGEGDGDVWEDTNGRVVLRAEALGPRNSRAVVQAVVGRAGTTGIVRRIGWRSGT